MNTSPQIAFICYRPQERYTVASVADEDVSLLHFLEQKGLHIHREIWNEPPSQAWGNYDFVVLKSPWDYYDNLPLFLSWLQQMTAQGSVLLNPEVVIHQNFDKRYLHEIEKAGFNIAPTRYLSTEKTYDLLDFFRVFDTEKIILKPCISSGARNTFALTREELIQKETFITPLLKQENYMVQAFLDAVQTEGEWSFLFFNQQYSHCVLKKPRESDYRVQHYHGGTIHAPAEPSKHLPIAQAIVEKFATNCLYTRVDALVQNDVFYLMELELIEPFLFLNYNPNAYENYYRALMQQITRNK